ncbi:MAG: tyrosine--tRNA ligase [Rickettsiales bacterium]|nr:tyrosine--tRNA ligase [Rickettsiales bacterium]
MTLIDELKYRGFINQCTNEDNLIKLLNSEKLSFYIGFDCTAKSLHVGSLIQIMIMRIFQKYGHTPIILIGKGTTRIGDPSGKDETRKILSEEEISENAINLVEVFKKYLNLNSGENKAIVKDNSDWLDKLNYVNFLRDYGKHFTINKMLTFDSVKLRLDREQSLSFVEFNYMIFQAYDFLELHKRNNCQLQIGGSDQWGNIVNGIELIRRVTGNDSYGLTTPLLTNANGEKMGKTASGAVWLNEDHLSPYDYWQFWRNVDDRDVIKFLKLFTDLDENFISECKLKIKTNINDVKIILANEATKMLHGQEKTNIAEQTAKEIFQEKGSAIGMPTLKLDADSIEDEVYIYDLIVKMKFASSKTESRKLIRGNGVKLNKEIVKDEMQSLKLKDLIDANETVISVGKKKYFNVKVK